MSQAASGLSNQGVAQPSSSSWMVPWLVGLVIGAGASAAGMYGYGFRTEEQFRGGTSARVPEMPGAPGGGGGGPMMGGMGPGGPGGPGGGAPGGGPPGGGGGGGPPMMGMGGMGGGGMGGMGGGGARGKRTLTALVGKLELLTRQDLKLHVDLSPEQVEKVAAKLAEMEAAEKMSNDDAQAHLEALEGLLTDEQRDTLDAVGLPFPGFGGGRGGGGGGPGGPGGGGPPGGGPGGPGGGMGMGGGGNPDENPFTQEQNQKRLKDLQSRLKPAA